MTQRCQRGGVYRARLSLALGATQATARAMKHLGVGSAEAQALARQPLVAIWTARALLSSACEPSPRWIRPRRAGLPSCGASKRPTLQQAGARRQEEDERGEHRVGEDADVEHQLVADVKGDRAGEGERVARQVKAEQRHDAKVEGEAAPRDRPREERRVAQAEGHPRGVVRVRCEPHLERLRAEHPVLVELGHGAEGVRDGEEQLRQQQVPVRHRHVRTPSALAAAPPPPRGEQAVERAPAAPIDGGEDKGDVADEDVVVVVVGLAQQEDPREGDEEHHLRGIGNFLPDL